MAFDKERNENRGENRDRGDRDRRGNSSGRPNFRGSRSGGGSGAGNSGRIENFEKPLMDLLKSINEKLDILIKK
ncbi:hypothetical protein [Spiroplasma endosymbiont of Labia minor]|uniref:hypothetical protein n=1 Tax=Spiroplasma endosymbiont of Labia minor TaxID=3066305 RepID=UPI0030D0ECA8